MYYIFISILYIFYIYREKIYTIYIHVSLRILRFLFFCTWPGLTGGPTWRCWRRTQAVGGGARRAALPGRAPAWTRRGPSVRPAGPNGRGRGRWDPPGLSPETPKERGCARPRAPPRHGHPEGWTKTPGRGGDAGCSRAAPRRVGGPRALEDLPSPRVAPLTSGPPRGPSQRRGHLGSRARPRSCHPARPSPRRAAL